MWLAKSFGLAAIFVVWFATGASAQFCKHRSPPEVARGVPRGQGTDCLGAQPRPAPTAPAAFRTASTWDLVETLKCDMIAAAKWSRTKPVDIAKAKIKAELTTTLVASSASGVALDVPKIPVFSIVNASGGLSASQTLKSTSSDKYTFEVRPAEPRPEGAKPCESKQSGQWLIAKLGLNSDKLMGLTAFVTELDFVVGSEKKADAKIGLLIFPVALGPTLERSNSNTQHLKLDFNFVTASAEAPKSQ